MITENEFYEKIYPSVKKNNLEKIKNAKIAIAGLGGLGSNVAIMLTKCGFKKFHLIDFDVVEFSNLNRQNYNLKDINLPKTTVIKEKMLEINPFCEIFLENIKVTEKNVSDIFNNDSIIVEAFDKPKDKALLANSLIGKVVVASCGISGISSPNEIKTRKITKNLYICGDFTSDIETNPEIFAPRINICAAHQATTVLRLVLGHNEV